MNLITIMGNIVMQCNHPTLMTDCIPWARLTIAQCVQCNYQERKEIPMQQDNEYYMSRFIEELIELILKYKDPGYLSEDKIKEILEIAILEDRY